MDGRVNNGGARPNTGPKPRVRADMQETLDKTFPQAAREKVIKGLVDKALGDDPKVSIQAATLLLYYCYGKPVARTEVSGSEGNVLSVIVRYADEV